ncbi:MAG: helix-turn-helix transcriptional regulator, partial [Bacteroidota bacterium]
ILMILLSRFLQKSKKQGSSSSFSRNYISQTIRYIHLHLNKHLEINQLAENIHLSPDYFSRLFTSIMGIRPIKYIQMRRIERAQLLLATTSHSLEEIAHMVGLNNRSYFSRLFKAHTGVSPSAYRHTRWTI